MCTVLGEEFISLKEYINKKQIHIFFSLLLVKYCHENMQNACVHFQIEKFYELVEHFEIAQFTYKTTAIHP